MIWKISKSSHFKLLIKCFQAIVIKLQREKFFKVALLSYKKMALLALFKTNHTGPSSTGSLGLHQISADIGSPVCSLPKSWDINKPNLFPQITLQNHLSPKSAEINDVYEFAVDFWDQGGFQIDLLLIVRLLPLVLAFFEMNTCQIIDNSVFRCVCKNCWCKTNL